MPRHHEWELELGADPEDVWHAIADAEGLRRWFVEDARVTPGEGGTIWYRWAEGEAGENRIEAWEPGRLLRLRGELGDVTLAEEWEIETRGGRTTLRFVHSNIPDSDDWDAMYDSVGRGWTIFLRTLRHYLERHPGKPRRTIYLTRTLGPGDEDVWERLTNAEAVLGSLAGEVLVDRPGSALLAVAPELDDGLVALSHEGTSLWCVVSAYGGAGDRLDALEPEVRAAIGR